MRSSVLLYMLGMGSACVHALVIPQADHGGQVPQASSIEGGLLHPDLHRRAPPKPAAPKPVAPKPVAPKPVAPKPVAPKPAPVGKPGATPKPTPAPAAGPIKWAPVKVPYVTTAFDTCDYFVECDESEVIEGALVARDDSPAVTITHAATGPLPTPAPALVGRDVRTFKPKGLAAGFTMKNLDYPGAPDLFTPPKGAKVAVNVFDYASDKVADYKVKNLKVKPAKYGDYVTEHIVELQTMLLFFQSTAVSGDAKIKAFLAKWWNAGLDVTKVANRPNKPAITMGDRKTLNNLVFEALGSDINREDFVLCESEINGYKARIWDTGSSPMANAKYKTAVKEAASGAIDSNVYLSALRSTLAVFDYLNEKEVATRLKASVKNVGTELKNIEHLTAEKLDLATPWQNFMKSHLQTVETDAKKWISERITLDTEPEITKTITALKKKETELKKAETSAQKADHEKKAKIASDKLDLEIKTAETAVDAQQKVVKAKEDDLTLKRDAYNKKSTDLRNKDSDLATLQKNLAAAKKATPQDAKKVADLEKQEKTLQADQTKLDADKKTTKSAKEAAVKARKKARDDLIKKQKVVGLKNREKFSLRSEWLKKVIDGLEADQKIVAAFKTAGAAIKAPSAV